jgi:KDO2-lipid IV(A) lauroyltransferase
MRKPLQSRVEYISFLILYYGLKLLPLGIIKFLAAELMIFGGMVLGIRRKIAVNNLKMVYPEKSQKEINIILKKMYRDMGKTAAETYFANFNKLYEKVELEGWEHLEEAIKMGKGVILASCHTGNWELAGRYINTRYKLSVIYKKLRNRYFNDFTYSLRENDGLIMIEKKKALRTVLKLLKEKYIVTIMIDQNARKDGVLVDFLGHPASTYVGMAKIAIKNGTPIVSAIAIRQPNGVHKFFFEPIISPEGYKNNLDDIRELTEIVSKQIEKYILKYPSQWFWVHRRWRGSKKARKTN